jgi:hypothetical protein
MDDPPLAYSNGAGFTQLPYFSVLKYSDFPGVCQSSPGSGSFRRQNLQHFPFPIPDKKDREKLSLFSRAYLFPRHL